MSKIPRVLFLGGNGHSSVRLDAARAVLADRGQPFELEEAPYPGFEGRPRAPSLDSFLDAISEAGNEASLIYCTGIGGLLALCQRARARWRNAPLVLQGAVLWGLERRLMPKVMRLGLARIVLTRLFQMKWFQRHFARTKFTRLPPAPFVEAFFAGYSRCTAAPDFFAWLTPALLRDLERAFSSDPAALDQVTMWWGERDPVVTTQELRWTEEALHVRWPLKTFPTWGHYPMIDEPAAWIEEVHRVMATPGTLS